MKSFLKSSSLKDLLLFHELIFIILILVAIAAGGIGIHLRDQSFQESQRINLLIQEVEQTRGDLYRQMKELFDAFLLEDANGIEEYEAYTQSIEAHFVELKKLVVDDSERNAIIALEESYQVFVTQAPVLFDQYQASPNAITQKTLYDDIESGVFSHYELVSKRIELLLLKKQHAINQKLAASKKTSNIFFAMPLILAGLLLFFSRFFLNFGIVKPINRILKATTEISSGQLANQVPLSGSAELIKLSSAINKMAEDLKFSQESLVRTEKQAAQGLLVPMLAHNIRNPLASIRATAQVMDDPTNDAETRESLLGIIDTVDRLERWTGALLAYLHPLRPQLGQANIKEIVEGALAPLKQKVLEKSIQIKLPDWFQYAPSAENKIVTDPHLLEQVIYNLLLNAMDASSKDSALEVQVSINAHEVEIKLLDSGVGMPFVPDPSAISAPTTKRFGTGIGIPFCFKVCDALGGSLQFSARAQGGTAVTISLINFNKALKP
ncbi:MAG: HAMP domain-containing protein [Methylotenera sp.]|nr:HAMP domain-containing protein [Methylotenera sp.]